MESNFDHLILPPKNHANNSKRKLNQIMSGEILAIGQGGDDEASRDVEEVIVTDGKVSQMVEKEILPDPAESKVKSPVKMVSKGIQVDVQPPPYRYSDLCNTTIEKKTDGHCFRNKKQAYLMR